MSGEFEVRAGSPAGLGRARLSGLLRKGRSSLAEGPRRSKPGQARRQLADMLAQHTTGTATSSSLPVDIQLLGQITPPDDWPKLLAFWERRNPGGTRAWPRSVANDAHALNLWPLEAGRMGLAPAVSGDVRKRQPRQLVCTPGLIVFDGAFEGDPETALAIVCATWIRNDAPPSRLAPPILEQWSSGGRLLTREVVDFGLPWSLPPADGLLASGTSAR
jgi:hypothetical protein